MVVTINFWVTVAIVVIRVTDVTKVFKVINVTKVTSVNCLLWLCKQTRRISLCEYFLLLLKLYLAGKKSFVSVNEGKVCQRI